MKRRRGLLMMALGLGALACSQGDTVLRVSFTKLGG